jgi:hypothetical protein
MPGSSALTFLRNTEIARDKGSYPFVYYFTWSLTYLIFFLYLLSNSFNFIFDPLITDEPQRVWLSQLYFNLILQRDFKNPEWQESYNGFGTNNPKISQYIMGISLLAAGELNTRFDGDKYDWDQGMDWNIRHGRTPPWRTLFYARLPMAFLEAACGILLLFIVSRALSPVPSLLAALFFGGHPQMAYFGGRAMQDIPALFFALLFLSVLIKFCTRDILQKSFIKGLPAMLAAGIILGVALQTKLNNMVLVPILALYLAWISMFQAKPKFRIDIFGALNAKNILLGALCLFTAWEAFIQTNPYISSGSILGSLAKARDLVEVNTMLGAYMKIFPGQILNGPADKVAAINHLLFMSYLYIRIPELAGFFHWGRMNIFYLMAFLGILFFCFAWHRGFQSGDAAKLDPIMLMGMTAAVIFAGNFYWVPLRWTRYFLPFLVPISILLGFGFEFIVQLLAGLVRRAFGMRPSPK